MSRTLGFLTALTGICLLMPSAHAEQLAFVHASSQLEQNVNARRYHPINLLDRDPNTLWCEGAVGAGAGESVQFVFKTAQTVDRVVITPAAQSGRTIETLRLSDGLGSVRLQVPNGTVDQVLTTPLHGDTYTLTIEHVGSGTTDPNAPFSGDVACLADVTLYHGSQRVTASHQDEAAASEGGVERIAGSWQAEPLGAPESSIEFALDGTWTWVHTPLGSDTATQHVHGTYRIHGKHLLMRKGNGGHWFEMSLETHRVVIDPRDLGAPAGDYDSMTLGDALGKEIGGNYNNAQF